MRIRLNIAAPVRVGGREQQVNKLEFVRHDGKLHAISPRKLAELLRDRSERALDDWNTEVLTRGRNADLTAFLRRKDLLNTEVAERMSRYSALCDHKGVNEFQPHARDAFGRLFIPGTAIKGAVRVAVMWALVDGDKANDYIIEKEEESARSRQRLRKEGLARDLDKRALQSFRLPHSGGTAAHRDLMRAVKVSDAYGELKSRVEKIIIQSYTEGRTATQGGTLIYVECLAPDSWVEFDLKVDKKILCDFERQNKKLPFENEGELLSLIRDFYSEAWTFERRYYGVAVGEGEAPAPAEEPEEFPSQEDWIKQKYGQLSKTKQRRYRGEYRIAREEFEARRGRGSAPQQGETNPGIKDGQEIRVGKIKDFYAGACPGFRLGWGSGLMSTTVDMRLDEENMGKVLNVISYRHHKGDPKEGPKSRKLVGPDKDPRWPMGWAGFEVIG